MEFSTKYSILKLPINYSTEDVCLFSKINDWDDFDDSISYIQNAKVFNSGIILKSIEVHPISYFGKSFKALSLINRLKLFFTKSEKTIETATWCSDNWGNGYFHWIVDTLQRYYSLKKSDDLILLLPEEYRGIGFIRESLDCLQIEHYWVKQSKPVKVKDLVLPAFIRPRGTCNPKLIELLSNKLRQLQFLVDLSKKPIYVSRQKAGKRKISNEQEVIKLMEKFGIEVLFMEDHSWAEQMLVLANSNVLIGLHGAGLSNMVMMPLGSRILEIRMETGVNQVCFFELANSLNHKYYYLKAKPETVNDTPEKGNCVVNIPELEELIKTILSDSEN